jgi:hypothetical protein
MRWDDDPTVPIGVIIAVVFMGIFVLGGVAGSELSENGNITKGRNQGIVLCTEKPKECVVEYQYIKLKETQK